MWRAPSSTTASMGVNGWRCDRATRFLEQWGVGPAMGTDSATSVSFTRLFLEVYGINISQRNTPVNYDRGGSLSVRGISPSGFTATNNDHAVGGFYWVARGLGDC